MNKRNTVRDLMEFTRDFFVKHWNAAELYDPPNWSEPYEFKGPLPNHDKQGVYAFIKEDEVIYVGVGTSKGSGRYRGHGLGKRFQAYSKAVGDDIYEVTALQLKDSNYMLTIGFESGQSYIANALELFLISKMDPEFNQNKPGS